MSTTQLKASLRLWTARARYRRRKLTFYRDKSKRKPAEKQKLIHKWADLTSLAERTVARRQRQLADKRPMRLRAFAHAQDLVGVMEQGGNNMGPTVSKIIRANGGTGPEPWCGDFVAYCYRLAGSKAVQRAWASAWALGNLAGMGKTRDPKQGHIAVYGFGAGHTGLFDKWVDRKAGIFLAIEGNTGASGAVSDSATGGDGVYRKQRHISQVRHFATVTR